MAATEASASPGKANLVVTLGALTVLAVVGGGLAGKMIVARVQGATSTPTPAATIASPIPYSGDIDVHELPPIVTNLANPADARVRLQVSIVFHKKAVENSAILTAQVGDDIVAFMKTVALKDLEGASGLQNLREDLSDRASTRSQGKVSEVIIEALVIQ